MKERTKVERSKVIYFNLDQNKERSNWDPRVKLFPFVSFCSGKMKKTKQHKMLLLPI